jgi:hypothetical protein
LLVVPTSSLKGNIFVMHFTGACWRWCSMADWGAHRAIATLTQETHTLRLDFQ